MHSKAAVARALAAAFLAGALDVDAMADRGARLLGMRWRWLRPLAQRVHHAFAQRTPPRQIAVARFILADAGFCRAHEKHDPRLVQRLLPSSMGAAVKAATSWNVLPLRTPGELADWLEISLGELSWFADLRTLESKGNPGRLRNYHYRLLAKRFGQVRLIEAPKPRLKKIQRRILDEILERVPPHLAAHGFRKGHSISSFAAPHTSQRVVLRLDLEDFFPSIKIARIQALFRGLGYPEGVADLLAGLCTNATPSDIWESVEPAVVPPRSVFWRYAEPHLPQGAPTSPALANLCAYRMDCRLAGLAESAGAVYTRYADDLAFSGGREFERVAKRFQLHASAIAMEEGFSVHHRKTRIMRQGVRQHLAGLVVNEHLNISRADYDRLKAILTNCIRHGALSQNRAGCRDFQSHLLGRISFVQMVNPSRAVRLRALFERIEW